MLLKNLNDFLKKQISNTINSYIAPMTHPSKPKPLAEFDFVIIL